MATVSASCLPAVLEAAIVRLRADAPLVAALGGAFVETFPPKGQPPPYLWVLSGAEEPFNRFKTQGRRGEIEVVAVSRFEGAKEIDQITSLTMQALDNVILSLSGYAGGHFAEGRYEWLRNERLSIEPVDSEHYFTRLIVFQVVAV